MTREALAQVGALVRVAGLLDARDRDVSTNTCGATAITPAASKRAACSSAIEPPSLWPNSRGRSTPSSPNSAAEPRAPARHEVGRPAFVERGFGVERP
jgi:hypothetical protein